MCLRTTALMQHSSPSFLASRLFQPHCCASLSPPSSLPPYAFRLISPVCATPHNPVQQQRACLVRPPRHGSGTRLRGCNSKERREGKTAVPHSLGVARFRKAGRGKMYDGTERSQDLLQAHVTGSEVRCSSGTDQPPLHAHVLLILLAGADLATRTSVSGT